MIDDNLTALAERIQTLGAMAERPVGDVLAECELDGNGPITQQLYRLLRRLIVEMRLRPNQFFSEKDVAAAFNISKTPVREAFIRLAEDGMLVVTPKSGTSVSPIDVNRVLEGYLIRSALESTCVQHLAGAIQDDGVTALRKELAAQKKALARKDYPAFYRLDGAFHDLLFMMAGLPMTKRLVEVAKFEVDRVRSLKLIFSIRRVDEVLAEHVAVVDALADRDPERARLRMLDHFSGMNDSIRDLSKIEKLWSLFNTINGGPPARRKREK